MSRIAAIDPTSAGLTPDAIARARAAAADDAKTDAILAFAKELVLARGRVDEGALRAVREAGVGEAEVLEVITNVALNIFTNYVNLVADTDIDFPVVRTGETAASAA
jgi:alkylhydroperoxidase family enzyme